MKTITFGIPCYNAAEYMANCVESLVACGQAAEVLIVNDGSTDGGATLACARSLEAAYPGIVRVVDQENKGHGGAVNAALDHASGTYFKVVDSDDWLNAEALKVVMDYLTEQAALDTPVDLVIANYIYEKVSQGTRQRIGYTSVLPQGREFTWDEIGVFRPDQNLLMHALIYRTDVLRECGIRLPEHCFYVDNIFAYEPLPHTRRLRYFDVDLYRYFIGREDQSVNESVMLSRIDMQLQITRHMIDCIDLAEVESPKLARYMYSYLSMMMCICSVFLRMDQNVENEAKRAAIWDYLRTRRPDMYAKVRGSAINFLTNLPSGAGRALGLGGYRIAQKIFKFN